MKKAVIITIGDEILSGNTVDTNSNFIASQLKNIGIQVVQILTISDEVQTIIKNLDFAFSLADIVITTGGLGPTRDDKTKKALAEYFHDEIVLDEATFDHLKNYLENKGRTHILERNKEQAFVPSTSVVFQNHFGTAPCMMMSKEGKISFSLPGVPYEVKPLVKDQIIPYLKTQFNLDYIISRIVSVVGIPESILADIIENWELSLPPNIQLSYLPIGSRVKLRLTALGENETILNKQLEFEIQKLFPLIGDHIIGTYEDKIEKILGELLTERKLTISTSESCTGGELAKLITSVPGGSSYFLGGAVTYATEMKVKLLNVAQKTIDEKTVVSEEVAEEMAKGCQYLFGSDIAISTTGVAGPGKGEDGKEVGTVYYTIRNKHLSTTQKLFLPHLERADFVYFVAQKIIQDVVKFVLESEKE